MSLHLGGVLETGIDVLDINLSDTVILTTENGVFVVTTTGSGGGLVVYRMGSNGQMQVADSQLFPGSLQGAISAQIAIVELGGETLVVFGGDSDDAFGYVLGNNGQLGAMRRVDWSALQEGAAQGAPGALQALALYDGIADLLVGTQVSPGNLVSVQSVSGHAQSFVLTLDSASGQVFSHVMNANGSMSMVGSIGAIDGLALANPTAMQIAEFDSGSYVVIASATGSSLSVVEILTDGSMIPVQQVIDTASTRFANVQDMTLVQDGDHVFVLAVGADHGVSLFRLLPDGHLVFVEAFSDDRSSLLNTPRSISAAMIGDTLHVFIGTQNTAQMVQLQSDHSGLGMVETSSASGADRLTGGALDDILLAGSDNDTLQGGGGNDILSSGVGRSTLTGGAGNDIFVIRAESSTVRVTDFRPGQDRLDLSDLPMLRNIDQLEIVPTATGAIIRFRDVEIIVTSADGGTLRRSDLFPNGLQGPDSMIIVIGEPEPLPGPPDPSDGVELIGGNGHDTLFGDVGPDTLVGNRGNDRLYGLAGNDSLNGGMGHDWLWGNDGNDTVDGGTGNDRLYGGTGNDRLFGHDDNDSLHGELGDDQIFAGSGNDEAFGGSGNDSLWGGTGDDLLNGGDGNDTLWGDAGNDTLLSGDGNDRISGGDGNDRIAGGNGRDL
ncbi:calcium-binding protein, partial [Roseibaca sp. Y0-43]|uniref:calcium-binding protein n=1 Tax=Roseibaca sp. Y0-43 TaxID=2816854 RepID=UPI001D0C502D